ncbi:hypothetical protein OH76DRAFT_1489786 [Lentinus brumalis]|uniref:Uncharacterized protein n=1 Tax=Lentinus brumalis TaxID=2498619 RepID=A0A371CLA6_9APHY|nr:hypothetical protein OH76DRAFT_1489786 [Polyporus brumalis]
MPRAEDSQRRHERSRYESEYRTQADAGFASAPSAKLGADPILLLFPSTKTRTRSQMPPFAHAFRPTRVHSQEEQDALEEYVDGLEEVISIHEEVARMNAEIDRANAQTLQRAHDGAERRRADEELESAGVSGESGFDLRPLEDKTDGDGPSVEREVASAPVPAPSPPRPTRPYSEQRQNVEGVEDLISVHEEFDHSINRIQKAYLKAQNPNEEIGGVISGESDVGELSESDWTDLESPAARAASEVASRAPTGSLTDPAPTPPSSVEQPRAAVPEGDVVVHQSEETGTLAEANVTDKSTEHHPKDANALSSDSSAEHSRGRILAVGAELHAERTQEDRTAADTLAPVAALEDIPELVLEMQAVMVEKLDSRIDALQDDFERRLRVAPAPPSAPAAAAPAIPVPPASRSQGPSTMTEPHVLPNPETDTTNTFPCSALPGSASALGYGHLAGMGAQPAATMSAGMYGGSGLVAGMHTPFNLGSPNYVDPTTALSGAWWTGYRPGFAAGAASHGELACAGANGMHANGTPSSYYSYPAAVAAPGLPIQGIYGHARPLAPPSAPPSHHPPITNAWIPRQQPSFSGPSAAPHHSEGDGSHGQPANGQSHSSPAAPLSGAGVVQPVSPGSAYDARASFRAPSALPTTATVAETGSTSRASRDGPGSGFPVRMPEGQAPFWPSTPPTQPGDARSENENLRSSVKSLRAQLKSHVQKLRGTEADLRERAAELQQNAENVKEVVKGLESVGEQLEGLHATLLGEERARAGTSTGRSQVGNASARRVPVFGV